MLYQCSCTALLPLKHKQSDSAVRQAHRWSVRSVSVTYEGCRSRCSLVLRHPGIFRSTILTLFPTVMIIPPSLLILFGTAFVVRHSTVADWVFIAPFSQLSVRLRCAYFLYSKKENHDVISNCFALGSHG